MLLTTIKRQLSETVRINHALATDLDASRRIIADLSRQRELLQKELTALKAGEARVLRHLPVESQGPTPGSRTADAPSSQSGKDIPHLADQRFHAVSARLNEVQREQDDLLRQLHQSYTTTTMAEPREKFEGSICSAS